MAAFPSGFALRKNGTCEQKEVDCGNTIPPYRVCCPAGSFCPSQYSINCCPTELNCTETLVQNPHCANRTWDLYDNNGYFCCQKGTIGYAARLSDSDGCQSPGYVLQSGEVTLELLEAGQEDTSSSVSPSTTSSGPSKAESSNPNVGSTDGESGPSLGIGAKVGIGVGVGVAGIAVIAALAWGVYGARRRAMRRRNELPAESNDKAQTEMEDNHLRELGGKELPVELNGSDQTPVELPTA